MTPVQLVTQEDIKGVLYLTRPDMVGNALIETTGPPRHVEEVLGAVPGAHPSETLAYEAAGFEWVPPGARCRELGESKALVTLDAVKGDLHVHTDWSPDGKMTLNDVLASSIEHGYEYVLITDHTIGLRFGGLSDDEILKQAEVISRARMDYPTLSVLHGAEVNIDDRGGLDLEDETLAVLDFVVAGVHSSFHLSREQQTARLARAVRHPAVGVLAHPTGRRIGIRPGIDFDPVAVIENAIEHNVALECNGHRDRLDLSASWIELAAARGARFAANSDAHRTGEMTNVANSIATLQKGGAKTSQVINSYPVDELLRWVKGGG